MIIDHSISNTNLKTPFRLLTQSLETTDDNLRAFVASWSAIEILINKAFPYYEGKFIAGIVSDNNSQCVNDFLGRIKDVMKDKYKLTDKFLLIASFLSDETEEDVALFWKVKKTRDRILHGEQFDEESLPVEEAES